MGKDLRDLVRLAGLDLRVKALDDHLAEALRGAHDVGRVHRLVGTDQDEPARAVDHGRVGGLVGAEHVVLDRFAGRILHERHVLVGGRVVDDVRMILFKDFEHLAAVADGPDKRDKIELRIFFAELELDVVGVIFVNVKDDQLLRIVPCDLPAELGADGAAAPGDEDDLAVDEAEDLLHVGADRFAAEKVLDRDLLHVAHGELAGRDLVNARELLQLAAGLVADGQDVALVLHRGARDREVDLPNPVLGHGGHDFLAAADDRDAVDEAMPFVRVVVDDAGDELVELLGAADVALDHLAGRAGADEHDGDCGGFIFLIPALPDEEHKAVAEADAQDRAELQQSPYKIVGNRHAVEKQRDEDRVDEECQHR